ncbi:hypothetical protein Bca4012_070373 [Brassica carinata]|uniref:BnaC05g09280D protein n=2 Tax=Brassica TaxID=3705 RepID=A0A078G1R1_BRANA|nr:BnaC05g09280D [Brassica napus]VDD42242.1 unnamed protein product [Brassica oleracea]
MLRCSPVMTHKICVETSSVSMLHHLWKTGWKVSLAAEANACSTWDVVQGVVWRFIHFGFGSQGLSKYLNPPL